MIITLEHQEYVIIAEEILKRAIEEEKWRTSDDETFWVEMEDISFKVEYAICGINDVKIQGIYCGRGDISYNNTEIEDIIIDMLKQKFFK